MRKTLVVFAMFLVVFVCAEVAKAELYSTISGYVTEEGTGKPIVGQPVRAFKVDNDVYVSIKGVTDGNGLYVLQDVISGTYNVSLEELYQRNYYSVIDSIEIVVIGDKNIVNNNYTIKKAGFVSGRIFKGDGTTPYVGARVIVEAGLKYQFSTSTDENGFYKVGGLPETEEAAVILVAPGMNMMAREVGKIISGAETKNIDITVVKDASNLAIKGKVLSKITKEPLAGAKVIVISDKFMAEVGMAIVDTDANGEFEVHGLPPGVYDFTVRLSGYEALYDETGEVKEGEIPLEIELLLKPRSNDTS